MNRDVPVALALCLLGVLRLLSPVSSWAPLNVSLGLAAFVCIWVANIILGRWVWTTIKRR
jgi:hypothetical protein